MSSIENMLSSLVSVPSTPSDNRAAERTTLIRTVTTENVLASVADAFPFTVSKWQFPGPNGEPTPFYGLFRSDNGQLLGKSSVTESYHAHQTSDILALVEAAAYAFDGEVEVTSHFRGGHYVSLSPTKDYRKSIFQARDSETSHDNIFPRILIHAGYEGQAFKSDLGYYRDACSNMHLPRQIEGTHVAFRHMSGLQHHIAELVDNFSQLKSSWGTLTNVICRLEEQKIQLADFLRQVYPEKEGQNAQTRQKHRIESIFARLKSERIATGRELIGSDLQVSAWEAFNGVQGYVQHESTRRKGFKGAFDRFLMAQIDPAVVRAENLIFALAS